MFSALRAARSSALLKQQTRTKTSLIPPNISSLKEIGKLQSAHPQAHPEIFAKMKSFYSKIPKGPKAKQNATTLFEKYHEKVV